MKLTQIMNETVNKKVNKNDQKLGITPVKLGKKDLEKVKFMFQRITLNQDLRDVLGFDQVYTNQISIKDGKIVISVFSKPRK
jgi:hypothetical protein